MRYIECGSLVAVRALLLASDRAAILSSHQASYEIEKGDLKVLDIELPGSERTIGVTTRKNWRPTGLQARFLGLLDAEVERL